MDQVEPDPMPNVIQDQESILGMNEESEPP